MIDAKFNQLPVDSKGDFEDTSEESLTEKQRSQRARSGLSINDTIAGGTNLSVGARGVNTSGVDSGSGVGAGSTTVTPGTAGESPAPEIVPGGAKTGTTPQSSSAIEQSVRPGVGTQASDSAVANQPSSALGSERASRIDAGSEGYETSRNDIYNPTRDEIAARAHQCWIERGCPTGSPEIDWRQAEEELRSGRVAGR